jgi:hypothetical protein
MPHIRHTATLVDPDEATEHTIVAYQETPFGEDEWTPFQRQGWASVAHTEWIDQVVDHEWEFTQ